jgi:hypothetical protein
MVVCEQRYVLYNIYTYATLLVPPFVQMAVHGGWRYIGVPLYSTRFPNIGTEWRRAVRFTLRPLFTRSDHQLLVLPGAQDA